MTGRKKTLMVAGGLVIIIIIIVFIVLLSFDINSYKSKIETAVSETTGLDFRIKGKMTLAFFPFGLSAKDVHVANKEGEILSLEYLKLRAEMISLLKNNLTVTACELVKPVITIVKDVEGQYNFDRKILSKETQGIAFSLNELKVSRGTMVYLNKKIGANKVELKEISLTIRNLFLADTSGNFIKNVSYTGNIDCKAVLYKNLTIENLKAPIRANKGVFSIEPFTMSFLGGKGEGDFTSDETTVESEYRINVKVLKLDFEKLEEYFGSKKVISGKGDLSASLTVKENGGRNLMGNLDGTFALRGDNLVTNTMDLDKVLSKYETSQQFDLIDLGSFFIAGPLGPVVLRGYRYGDVYYHAQGGKGAITRFISHWKITKGEADATDCAFATRHNRVALKGKLNLVSERFDNVTVALLDDKGCARFKQSVSGHFDSPQIGTVSAVKSLAGPIFDLYRKAKRIVQAGKCEVFYNGSVQQPH